MLLRRFSLLHFRVLPRQIHWTCSLFWVAIAAPSGGRHTEQ